MTQQQATWAEQHDWHRATLRKSENAYGVKVADIATQNGEALPEEFRIFYSFKALREWAGY